MSKLIFGPFDKFQFGTNSFVNVHTILQYEHTPLIEIVKNETLQLTTQVSVYRSDGTYLAKIKGSRIQFAASSEKANLIMDSLTDRRICRLDNRVIFELRRVGKLWEIDAELYAPDSTLISGRANEPFRTMMGNGFDNSSASNCAIGLLVTMDGGVSFGIP